MLKPTLLSAIVCLFVAFALTTSASAQDDWGPEPTFKPIYVIVFPVLDGSNKEAAYFTIAIEPEKGKSKDAAYFTIKIDPERSAEQRFSTVLPETPTAFGILLNSLVPGSGLLMETVTIVYERLQRAGL